MIAYYASPSAMTQPDEQLADMLLSRNGKRSSPICMQHTVLSPSIHKSTFMDLFGLTNWLHVCYINNSL